MRIIEKIYRYLQRRKETSILYPGTRELEERTYLTMKGIKNWDELSISDKLSLNIRI